MKILYYWCLLDSILSMVGAFVKAVKHGLGDEVGIEKISTLLTDAVIIITQICILHFLLLV